jgi:hypothetical protein
MFSIARAAAVAAVALGTGALLTPAPAEAQGRHGYSAGGGARVGGGVRVSGPRMGAGGRVGIAPRGYAPRVAGSGFRAAGYRHPGYRPGFRPGVRPVVRPGWRPAYHNRGWYRGGYWPAAAGVGLGIVGAAAIANSGYYYANDGYYSNGYAAQQCWLERRTVRTSYGPRVINVRVCPHY